MIKLFRILILLFRKFGFRFIYILIPFYRFFYKLLYYFGYLIDEIFYRRYKKIVINKPVLLIGHPRSGTTFLHKFILKNSTEFEGMFLWRMMFPTLTSRFIVKPLLPSINRLFPKNLYDPNIHKTGFLEPETDDAALFFRSFDGMFSWLYFSALNDYNSISELEQDLVKTSKTSSVLKNLKIIFQKNLYRSYQSKRIFSKSFSLILNLKEVKETFNDSKLVILIRNPLEVIPSSLSLARNVQMNLNGFDKLSDKEKFSYYRNLYNGSIIFYKHLLNQINNGDLSENDYLLISYKDLIKDFDKTMDRIITYCEIDRTPEMIESIRKQSEKQPTFKGNHVYTLEEFGFTKEEVLRDFDFVYSRFDL
jgi:omega-hydroxy-beta-dihydromenaquinone-9 sulfotransferase